MKHRSSLTPGTPRFVAMRVTEDQDKLGTREHATYRRGVGTLLYLTKHSRLDLCNAVREFFVKYSNNSSWVLFIVLEEYIILFFCLLISNKA